MATFGADLAARARTAEEQGHGLCAIATPVAASKVEARDNCKSNRSGTSLWSVWSAGFGRPRGGSKQCRRSARTKEGNEREGVTERSEGVGLVRCGTAEEQGQLIRKENAAYVDS